MEDNHNYFYANTSKYFWQAEDLCLVEERRREDRRRAATKAEDEDIAQVSEKSVVVVKSKCSHCEEELRAHIESVHDRS